MPQPAIGSSTRIVQQVELHPAEIGMLVVIQGEGEIENIANQQTTPA